MKYDNTASSIQLTGNTTRELQSCCSSPSW